METARVSLDRLSGPSIEVLDYEGDIFTDGWMSREFSFRVRALESIESIELRLWNPDFANRYKRNRVTVTIGDIARTSPPLFPAQVLTFGHAMELRQGKTCDVAISTEQFCEPDALDERERGIILISASFTAQKAA